MGLKEGNKAKTEIDYELEKLIIKAERLPIYFNWYDFHRGKLNPPPAPLSGHLKRQMMANRIQANKKRAADKLRQIHKIFDPVMETMEKDFLKEKGKNPERAKRIAEEYCQVEKTVKDLVARTRRWSVAGDQILCCEYNVPAVRVLLEGEKSSGLLPTLQGVYHGAYTLYKYNTSDLLRNFKKLYNLEKEYAKFNNGCGLKALEEAKKRLDYWQRVHPEQWGDHELLLEQWDNHELYSGQFEDYEEAGIMTIEKLDWRNIGDRMWDDERTLLFKDGSRGNRKSIREYLKKTSGESVGKGEGTKGNSIREQSRSCQDRYSS